MKRDPFRRAASGGEVVAIVGIIALLAWLIYLVLAALFRWAWNLALVPMLGLPVIGFWQAFACVTLLSIIGSFFKSSGSSK